MRTSSFAMRRHLLNRQREQISSLITAIETHRDMLDFSTGADYHAKSVFETFGWLPQEMNKDNSVYVYDVFLNKIDLYFFW